MVPVALIKFENIMEQNWDLTMTKVRSLQQPLSVLIVDHHQVCKYLL